MTDIEFIKVIYDLAQQNAEHIRTLNNETGRLEIAMTQIATDVAWLTKTYWIIMGATMAGFVSSIITLLKVHKNNKK